MTDVQQKRMGKSGERDKGLLLEPDPGAGNPTAAVRLSLLSAEHL